MRVALASLLVLALAGAAGAASPGANVSLVFAQNLGPIEPREAAQHAYLCAAPPNGSAGRKVTPRDGPVVDPDVSPSGSDVAYVRTAGGPLGVLERVAAGGGSPARPAGNIVAGWPASGNLPEGWTEPRDVIFFASTGTTAPVGDLDIFRVPREGGTPIRIVGGPLREAMPTVSPNGHNIAFVRSDPARPAEAGGELWFTGAGPGFSQLRITTRSDITHPDYAPDGGRIVFAASDGIYVLRLFTPGQPGYTVEGPLARGTEPEFSPDGTRIAFARDGDVWIMSAQGGEEVNVTRTPIAESGPTWQSTAVPTGREEPCALVGTDGDDVITGSPYDDFVYDLGGDDTIRTLGGNDRVFDGQGGDTIETGDGDDRVLLRYGSNRVAAAAGDDEVATNDLDSDPPAPQAADGGPGADVLIGGRGGDRISGGTGNDSIQGLRGPDTIFGGPGDDRIEGNRGDDAIDGGLGNDVLFGGLITGRPANYDGYDVLLGRGGNDRLAGGWQTDRLFGGTGVDRLRGGPHADHLVGDAGADDVAGEGGDDLLLARERVRDSLSGGPGLDRARLDAVDRRAGIERVLR